MWPEFVIVSTPILHLNADVVKAHEPMGVQALGSELAIEAFDEGVLDWFARHYIVLFHFGPIRPMQDCFIGELPAVVTDDHLRLATSFDDPVQLTGKPQAGKGRVGDEGQAFSCAIIDDRKLPEPAAIGELI